MTRTKNDSARELEIMQEKIERELSKSSVNSKGVLTRIEKDGKMLEDYVAPLGINGDPLPKLKFSATDNAVVLGVATGKKGHFEDFKLHPHAAEQAGEKLNIPPAYIKRLVGSGNAWERELAAKVLNDHTINATRERVLIRTVGDEARAILSDKYRRLDTSVISESFIRNVRKNDARIVHAFYDDLRWGMEAIRPSVIPVPTSHNGTVYLGFGMRIQSSDFGDGALDMRAFFMQVVCMNGAVGERLMREVHLGARFSDTTVFSELTYKKDTETVASALQDVVANCFRPEVIKQKAYAIQKASDVVVDLDSEVKKLPRVGLLVGEIEKVKKVLMDNKPSDGVAGEPTLWKLAQAVSAVGRDSEQARRKAEIDEIVGDLILNVGK